MTVAFLQLLVGVSPGNQISHVQPIEIKSWDGREQFSFMFERMGSSKGDANSVWLSQTEKEPQKLTLKNIVWLLNDKPTLT